MNGKRTAIIQYGEQYIQIDLSNPDIGEMESAMRFKAEHIKAKADPQLFIAVADALRDMSDMIFRKKRPCDDCQEFSCDSCEIALKR